MSVYSDNLAHAQVVINCPYSVAHLCTSEAMLAYNLGALHFDNVVNYNSLTTLLPWVAFKSERTFTANSLVNLNQNQTSKGKGAFALTLDFRKSVFWVFSSGILGSFNPF